jgi:uncharacterized protein with HEPN domain
MLESLDRITEYTSGLKEDEFLASHLVQDAVVRNIGIVDEAAKQLLDIAPEFSSKHPEIPFAHVYSMRNRVIHGYSSVDPAVVWDVVQLDAPALRKQIAAVVEGLDAMGETWRSGNSMWKRAALELHGEWSESAEPVIAWSVPMSIS